MRRIIEFLDDNFADLVLNFTLMICAVFFGSMIIDVGVEIYEKNKYIKWYDTLPEEQQIVEREKFIQKYEIVNVDKYILPQSHKGSITGSEVCYSFQYIDGDILKTVADFKELGNGSQQIIVGDKNMYIIDDFNIDTYYYLQLTEETLKTCDLKLSH
jgi:hypothetical protein